MVIVLSIPEPGVPPAYVELLPRRERPGEAQLIEAWSGSVRVERDSQGVPVRMHGYVLDVVGDFPPGLQGVLQRIAPYEIPFFRDRQNETDPSRNDTQEGSP